MNIRILFEIIGYTGMIFLIISFLMKNLKWLRLLNIIGGVLCCAYGVLTETYPTAILNFILVCINISFPISWYIKTKKASRNQINEPLEEEKTDDQDQK